MPISILYIECSAELAYAWHIGKIVEVNRRRTKSENVSAIFNNPTEGETRGVLVADPSTYGAEKLWVLVRQVPVEISEDSDSSDTPQPSTSED